ncbi:MAG: hypothetical protein J6O04_06000, partial [Selenomonadaceae bacterium]|nr:hypothetical protein [Selenomonadaceae bacterium]
GGNVKVTFLLYIHKMRNQRASPERGGARRAEGLTMKSNIFLFLLPVRREVKKTLQKIMKSCIVTGKLFFCG